MWIVLEVFSGSVLIVRRRGVTHMSHLREKFFFDWFVAGGQNFTKATCSVVETP